MLTLKSNLTNSRRTSRHTLCCHLKCPAQRLWQHPVLSPIGPQSFPASRKNATLAVGSFLFFQWLPLSGIFFPLWNSGMAKKVRKSHQGLHTNCRLVANWWRFSIISNVPFRVSSINMFRLNCFQTRGRVFPSAAHCFPLILFLSNLLWLQAKKTNKHKTSLSVCACLPSKPVVSHTQASSKNGLFHLTQVMTAAPAAAAAAAAVWPKHPPNLPRALSSRSAFIPTRMDKFSRPPVLHPSSSILLCCRLRPAPSVPLSLSELASNLVAVDVIFSSLGVRASLFSCEMKPNARPEIKPLLSPEPRRLGTCEILNWHRQRCNVKIIVMVSNNCFFFFLIRKKKVLPVSTTSPVVYFWMGLPIKWKCLSQSVHPWQMNMWKCLLLLVLWPVHLNILSFSLPLSPPPPLEYLVFPIPTHSTTDTSKIKTAEGDPHPPFLSLSPPSTPLLHLSRPEMISWVRWMFLSATCR